MSSAKRVHKSASTYTSGCPVSLSKLTLKRSAKQLRYSFQSPTSSARPKFSMTRSISARVQSVSIICSWDGPALPSFIFLVRLEFRVDLNIRLRHLASVLDRKPQAEGSGILEISRRRARHAGRGRRGDHRPVRHVLDPGADGPGRGIVGERGVALVRGDLFSALIVHVVGPPLAFEAPVDMRAQRPCAKRNIVRVAPFNHPIGRIGRGEPVVADSA